MAASKGSFLLNNMARGRCCCGIGDIGLPSATLWWVIAAAGLKFSLNGQKLRGMWNLVRMGARDGEGKENWLLIKEKDDEARSGKKVR